VHITGAFQMAGYAHVVGTLWPVVDDFAAQVADCVYDGVAAGAGQAALALHEAVRRQRAQHPDRPALWAAHIHVGP
jgi:CHAT domain-containing protein